MASSGVGERLRGQLLTALQNSDRALTTAELRDHVLRQDNSSAVIETVYRNLTVLQRRGDVERQPGPGRDAYWAIAVTQQSVQDRPA